MEISAWYQKYITYKVSGRYVTLAHLSSILDNYRDVFPISIVGVSELGVNIPMIQIGNGGKKVLAWSQMHGNESTTTKAVFDFLEFISQKAHFKKEITAFLESYSLYFIPILNPDGANVYTRENANSVDLNRDAKACSQRETRVLKKVFNEIKPNLCLNLHDQRTMYSLPNGLPATISFLSPAANPERTVTSSRKIAMTHIVRMYSALNKYIPGQIGRYDDTFNENCIGDSFQMEGVPTILFEAGHYQGDYQREKTREYLFYSLIALLELDTPIKEVDFSTYFSIPENEKKFKDLIIKNVLTKEGNLKAIAINFKEVLEAGNISFVPVLDAIVDNNHFLGHKWLDAEGVPLLFNFKNEIEVGDEISIIVNKNDKNQVIFEK